MSKWCLSDWVLKWLRGGQPPLPNHRDHIEVDKRNLAQTKQLIQSSENRVNRAVEMNERIRQQMTTTKQGLERNLDELARRIQRLQRSHDEEESKH